MKSSIAVALTCIALAVPVAACAQSAEDRQAVENVMQDFLRAFETDDQELLRRVFRSDGVMVGYSKSKRAVQTTVVDEWAKNFNGEPARDEAQRKRSFQVLDVTDTGAVCKLILDYPSWSGVDYIALQKIEGAWTIVSKSWSGKAKATAPR